MVKLLLFVFIISILISCSSVELVQKSELNVVSKKPIINNGYSIIVGTVSSRDTLSMAGTIVQLTAINSNKNKLEAIVDSENIFRISDVPFGKYAIDVKMIGYANIEHDIIDISPNTILLVEVVLTPKAVVGCDFPVIVAP